MTHQGNRSRRHERLELAEVIGALSVALDLAEGQPAGHALRTCWIGMHIAEELGVGKRERQDLYYALLLKDLGCTSTAAKVAELYGYDDVASRRVSKWLDLRKLGEVANFLLLSSGEETSFRRRAALAFKLVKGRETYDRELVAIRCRRGADVALELDMGANVAAAVHSKGEHWDGSGGPDGLVREEIHLGARIVRLAEAMDAVNVERGREAAVASLRSRRGDWFDPVVVDAAIAAARRHDFWSGLVGVGLERSVRELEPIPNRLALDDRRLDRIARVFARVIDAKSAFTSGHSQRVAGFCELVAEEIGLSEGHRMWLRRGALLHDIGKLGVSSAILDKPGVLDEGEWEEIAKYPAYTESILARITPYRHAVAAATSHRERLASGSSGPVKRRAQPSEAETSEELPLEARIISLCDIYDALTSERPHRPAMSMERAFEILEDMRDHGVDGFCLDALRRCTSELRLSTGGRLQVA